MAILWNKEFEGSYYEVRSAGSTLRLYTNGVLHSQYNARTGTSNGVWDMLVAPGFVSGNNDLQRILVLGLGGGATVHMLQRFFKPQQITAIELNPLHIYIAKRFFKLNRGNIELIQADALDWLKRYSGAKFDLIIEDLFTEEEQEPVRVTSLEGAWFAAIRKNLQRNGILVANFVSQSEFRRNAKSVSAQRGSGFQQILQLTRRAYENRVGVFLPTTPGKAGFERAIKEAIECTETRNRLLDMDVTKVKLD